MERNTGIVEGENPENQAQTLILFYGRRPIYSNFVMTMFKVDGRQFNCTEQYFQYQKAKYFDDQPTAGQIMKTGSPARQKKLGRSVKGYDEQRWRQIRMKVMEDGCMAKFTQNQKAKETLLATGDKILVECTPNDRVWGNGLHLSDKRALCPKKWRGTNLMGQVLMKVRNLVANEVDTDIC